MRLEAATNDDQAKGPNLSLVKRKKQALRPGDELSPKIIQAVSEVIARRASAITLLLARRKENPRPCRDKNEEREFLAYEENLDKFIREGAANVEFSLTPDQVELIRNSILEAVMKPLSRDPEILKRERERELRLLELRVDEDDHSASDLEEDEPVVSELREGELMA